jgi:transcriptional regulator with XRE-family HTH domain
LLAQIVNKIGFMNELNVNIGLAIEQRVNELGISKSELARRLGIAQQNVNKVIFSKESLDTAKLMEISKALDYNFFELYANLSPKKTSLFNSTKLQSLINDKGLGNIEFASKVRLTRNELANILEGGDVSLSMVEKIAEALDVKPTELINGATSTAEAHSDSDSSLLELEKQIIELKAENKVLRELQGLPAKKAVG